MSIFEQILPGWVVEDAVVDTLRTWMDTYLRELELQWTIEGEPLPSIRSWNVRPEDERWLEEQLPAVIVISPGLQARPIMEGDGTYRASFRMAVAIYAMSTSKRGVERNTKTYAAAARAIMLQKRGLGGLADDVEWEGEDYTPGPSDAQRAFGAALVNLIIHVHDTVNKKAGPAVPIPPDPDTLPGSEWPLAETETVVVNKL